MLIFHLLGLRKRWLPFLFCIFFTISSFSQGNPLSGIKTIGGTSPNYATINLAVGDLLLNGVAPGGVTFKIRPGVYNERVEISKVIGASDISRVVFEGESGDPKDVLIIHEGLNALRQRNTIRIVSASYVTLRAITAEYVRTNLTANDGHALHLDGGGYDAALSYNIVENCIFKAPASNAYKDMAAVAIGYYGASGATQNDRVYYNIFRNNTLIGGHQALIVSINQHAVGNEFYGNTFTGFYKYGCYVYTRSKHFFERNTIIQLAPVSGASELYGFYSVFGSDDIIANNQIILETTNLDAVYGIYVDIPSSIGVYHNSVKLIGSNSNSFSLFLMTSLISTSGNFMNNNLANFAGGPALGSNSAANIAAYNINNNNYYTTGTNISKWNNISYATLQDHKAANSGDANSINVYPSFLSLLNLRTFNPQINNKGVTRADVTKDIDSKDRSLTTPDIGINEFTPFNFDIALVNARIPNPILGNGNRMEVQLLNNGLSSPNDSSITIRFSIDNGVTYLDTQTFIINSVPSVGNRVWLTFSDSFTILNGGVLNVKAEVIPGSFYSDGVPENNLYSGTVCTPISGQIFVGGASDRYKSIQTLMDALACTGVSGNLEIVLRSGTYLEQININNLTGRTFNDTITIRSETGIPDSTIVQFAAGGSDTKHGVIILNDIFNVIIKDIKVVNTKDNAKSSVIAITDSSDHILIKNCILIGDTSLPSVSLYSAVVVICEKDNFNEGFNHADIRIEACTLMGSRYGVRSQGKWNEDVEYTHVEGNYFKNNSCAVGLANHKNFSILNNETYGCGDVFLGAIDIDFALSNFVIANNKFYNVNTVGMDIYQVAADNKAYIYNNMMSADMLSGISNGAVILGGDVNNIEFYHNTIYTKSKVSSALRLGNSSGSIGTGLKFYNNIFINDSTGEAIEHTGSMQYEGNNNLFYSKGPVLINLAGQDYATLGDFQFSTGQDLSSFNALPELISFEEDLHYISTAPVFLGVSVSKVKEDIDGDLRDPIRPLIGADELNFIDVGISKAYYQNGTGGNIDLLAEIQNYGYSVEDSSILMAYSIDSGATWSTSVAVALDGLKFKGDKKLYKFQNVSTGSFPQFACVKFVNSLYGDINETNSQFCGRNCGIPSPYVLSVGPVGSDFTSISGAIKHVDSLDKIACVFLGDVKIQVAPGIYNEAIYIPKINNLSQSSRLIIEGLSANPTDVQVRSKSEDTVTLLMNDAHHIVFKNFSLSNINSSRGNGILLENGGRYIEIKNCIITVPQSSSENYNSIFFKNKEVGFNTGYKNIVISNVETNFGYQSVFNNHINGSAILMEDLIIDSCNFKNFYTVGVLLSSVKDLKVSSNYLVPQLDNIYRSGILLDKCSGLVTISGNKIMDPALLGISITNSQLDANMGWIVNNMVGGIGDVANASSSGIFLNFSSNFKILHNSVLINKELGTDNAAIRLEDVDAVQLSNNIFSNEGKGYALYVSLPKPTILANYNNYYGTDKFIYFGQDIASIAEFNTVHGREMNGLSVLPEFLSFTDLHLFNDQLDNVGLYIATVPTDIDGQERDSIAPDIGADEFSIGKDLLVSSITSITQDSLYTDSLVQISAKIENIGNIGVSGFTVQLKNNNQILDTYNYSTNLESGTSNTISFATKLKIVKGANNVCVVVVLADDIKPSNNTKCRNVLGYDKKPVSVELQMKEQVQLYPNPIQATVYISSPSNLKWLNWKIYSMDGVTHFDGKVQGDQIDIPIESLTRGIYVLELQHQEGKIYKRVIF